MNPPPPLRYILEYYNKTPILIPMEIMEDVVKSVAHILSGSLGPGSTDSEALQTGILKFGEDDKIISSTG